MWRVFVAASGRSWVLAAGHGVRRRWEWEQELEDNVRMEGRVFKLTLPSDHTLKSVVIETLIRLGIVIRVGIIVGFDVGWTWFAGCSSC